MAKSSLKIGPKVALISLGCPKNLVDSEIMMARLATVGYSLVLEPRDADYIVVNTCGFIADAEAESMRTIKEVSKLKASGRCKRLVVAGCLSQRYKEKLSSALPEVDLFLGVGDYDKIDEILRRRDAGIWFESGVPIDYGESLPRLQCTPFYTAYLKVAEGCSRSCAFCTIPQIRGPFRSRPPAVVIEEGAALAANGVVELNLIAQETTSYGRDLRPPYRLSGLLCDLEKIEGLRWIRVLYSYPTGLDDELLSTMAGSEKVCSYIDLPLQHVSDKILRHMKRGTTKAQILELVEKIRSTMPGTALRTSLIVGFPGETEDDFQELLSFIRNVKFDRLGAFSFSPERGTEAALMEGKVPKEIVRRRLKALMELQAKISFEKNKELIGKTLDILIEGRASGDSNLLIGRTAAQAPEVDGQVYIIKGEAPPGEIRKARVIRALTYDLEAEIL